MNIFQSVPLGIVFFDVDRETVIIDKEKYRQIELMDSQKVHHTLKDG